MLPLDIAHPLPRAEAAPECVLAHCSPARRGLFVFLAKPSRAVDPLAGRGTGRVDAASCKRVGRPHGFSLEAACGCVGIMTNGCCAWICSIQLFLVRSSSADVVKLSLWRTRDGETGGTAHGGRVQAEQQRAADARPETVGVHGPNRHESRRSSPPGTVGGVETFSVNQLRTWEQVFTDVTGSADDSEERNRAVAACSSRRGSMARSSKKTWCCEVVEQRAAVGSPYAARDRHLKL
jgi:hypothetical protein